MNLIRNVLGFTLGCLLINGCTSTPKTEVITVQTRPVEFFPPIVPSVDDLRLRKHQWVVVTEQNYQGVLMMLKDSGQDPVLYALSQDGYISLTMNQSDIMKVIRQQQEVIAVYRNSYD
jgi:hypothetical protein